MICQVFVKRLFIKREGAVNFTIILIVLKYFILHNINYGTNFNN